MFKKLSLLALIAPLVSALSVEVPQNPKSSSPITIRWHSDSTDAASFSTFSIFLINEVFHDSFGIANNVMPELGEITLTLPVVPARDGYTINLVDIGNVNNVFAMSAPFSVAESTATDTTSASGSTKPGSSSSTTGRSTTVSSTPPATRPALSSSAFGTTLAAPSPSVPTGPSSAANSTSSASSSTTPSSAASVPLKMNTNVGTLAAVVISAIAGAVVVAL